jgi:bacterioferritin
MNPRKGSVVRGSPEVIEVLNEILTAELTAINQYFIHAKMCENWGYQRLAEHNREESIDEMKDADRIIDRILYLEGVPNLQRLGTVRVGETVPEQCELDVELERAAVERYNRAIALCVDHGDNGTREILDGKLRGEEDHLDWLESQLELIRQVGVENYLATQIHG